MEMRQTEKEVLIQAVNVCKYFKVSGGRVLHAVEDVNLTIHKGEPGTGGGIRLREIHIGAHSHGHLHPYKGAAAVSW